ncbi:type II toxin-antitoxin system ParD family antitoxin [Mycetohabitans endofungorum]|uniref:type II toxin-antitoxin system ParD family antitoxin n=3 Tax=Burkholderiaceae TaxID=119060 RepID=UPI003BB08268
MNVTIRPPRASYRNDIMILITVIDFAKICSRHFEDKAMAISGELGQQLEHYVAQLITSGRYGSKSEVLREGVRLVQEREMQLAALDAVIERGVADSKAGKGVPAEQVFDRLESKYRKMASGDA